MEGNGNIDNVSPEGKWEFDSEVARCFPWEKTDCAEKLKKYLNE